MVMLLIKKQAQKRKYQFFNSFKVLLKFQEIFSLI